MCHFLSRGMKYTMTAMITSATHVIHNHSDLKDRFTTSNATIIQARMTATVLICNFSASFRESSLIFLCANLNNVMSNAITMKSEKKQ